MTKDTLLEVLKDLPGNTMIMIPDFSTGERDGFYTPRSAFVVNWKGTYMPKVELE